MAYELREGQGTLFPNRKKEPGSKQPDFRGNALVNGVTMEIAAWSKEGAKGSFLSVSIKPKEDRNVGAGNYEAQRVASEPKRYAQDRITSGPATRRAPDDEEIPFEMNWR